VIQGGRSGFKILLSQQVLRRFTGLSEATNNPTEWQCTHSWTKVLTAGDV
jgi:hypothetical protein